MQQVVFLNGMLLRGGVEWVEVGQRADGSGGICAEDDDVLVRERRRETSRKIGGATIFGMCMIGSASKEEEED